MVVTNVHMLESQQRRNTKERKKQRHMMLIRVERLFSCCVYIVLFSVLGADEVFTGQQCADAIHGRSKVSHDGATCHRGEGKSIIDGCTDGSRELPLRQ